MITDNREVPFIVPSPGPPPGKKVSARKMESFKDINLARHALSKDVSGNPQDNLGGLPVLLSTRRLRGEIAGERSVGAHLQVRQ